MTVVATVQPIIEKTFAITQFVDREGFLQAFEGVEGDADFTNTEHGGVSPGKHRVVVVSGIKTFPYLVGRTKESVRDEPPLSLAPPIHKVRMCREKGLLFFSSMKGGVDEYQNEFDLMAGMIYLNRQTPPFGVLMVINRDYPGFSVENAWKIMEP